MRVVRSRGLNMNTYKLRKIIELIQKGGKLPTDPLGQVLCVDDLLVWFGLDKHLTAKEREYIKRELAALTEAELFMDQLQVEQR